MKKFKRLTGIALALAMALSMSAPVLAAPGEGDGRDEVVPGLGQIGWGVEKMEYTEAPEFDAVTGGVWDDVAGVWDDEGDRVLNGTYNYDLSDGKNNVPGAEIVVTLPDTVTELKTFVDENGNWSVTLPNDYPVLVGGDVLTATQKEDGKFTSPPTIVVVDSGDPGEPTDPPINPPEPPVDPKNPEHFLTLTVPSGFYWWATQETDWLVSSKPHYLRSYGLDYEKNVYQKDVNGDYVLDANGEYIVTGTEQVHEDPNVQVSVASFTQANGLAGTVANDLELYFTRDFVKTGIDGNLNNGLSITTPVEVGVLTSNGNANPAYTNELQFGFRGEYKGAIPSEMLEPEYEMILHFEILP